MQNFKQKGSFPSKKLQGVGGKHLDLKCYASYKCISTLCGQNKLSLCLITEDRGFCLGCIYVPAGTKAGCGSWQEGLGSSAQQTDHHIQVRKELV